MPKKPAPTSKKSASELTEKDLNRVAGGFNPQPDPPGKRGLTN